jgi:hypothetical protein
MPRFVILEHDHPQLHWDLMLEDGAALRTWRLLAPLQQGETFTALRSLDHRLLYLDYEGPISGGRGQVSRRDRGDFIWRVQAADRIEVYLAGDRWRGVLRLEQEDGEIWRGEFLTETVSP